MQCDVYRSSKHDGMYVYVVEGEDLADLPGPVQRQLGTPELALSFTLTEDRELSNADAAEVLANIEAHGFHLQMPRDIESLIAVIATDTDTMPGK